MRTASRLFASVKPARFLEPGNPTGLTGLHTHPTPRSTLLYLYESTLDKLKAIPEHSVYRQSSERIVKHRMSIVESIKPTGYDEWAEKAKKMVEEHPELFNSTVASPHSLLRSGRSTFVVTEEQAEEDERLLEWDGEDQRGKGDDGADRPLMWNEGSEDGEKESEDNPEALRAAVEVMKSRGLGQLDYLVDYSPIKWEPEPSLEASQ